MTIDRSVGLDKAIQILNELNEMAIENNISRQFLEFELSPNKDEFRINGNASGLLYLAKQILGLAANGIEGSHLHFDETGIADKCDLPVVFCLKSADWDKS